jgi:hypothetical protein
MLAVTLMKTGVCIAGVRRDAHSSWVRPVRDFGSVLLGDITYPPATGGPQSPGARRVMRPFDLVELTLGRARTEPPHVEDWICDFVHHRPRLLGVLPEGERASLLDAAVGQLETLWQRGTRSLCTLPITELTAIFRYDAYAQKYEARLSFPGLPAESASAPCTDLKWRAMGRRLLDERLDADVGTAASDGVRMLTLTGPTLWAALGGGGGRRCWLALGTTRAYDGRHWPLVVGVHTLPDYEAEVDYSRL